MRLIDADALKQSIREIMPSRTEVNILIDAQKSEIVMCRDCRFKECDGRDGTVVCDITGESHQPEWFCADGERRDG